MIQLTAQDFFLNSKMPVSVEPRSPQAIFPEHTHHFEEIFIVMSGHGQHVLDTQETTLTRNMVCRIPSQNPHLFEQLDNLFLVNVLFRPENFQNYSPIQKMLSELNVWHLSETDLALIKPLVNSLNEESRKAGEDARLLSEALFTQLLVMLWRSAKKTQDGKLADCKDPAMKLLYWLKENYQTQYSLSMLADKFGLSERSLTRRFKDISGTTPGQYAHQIRIDKARELLRNSHDSITDIGLFVGYSDSNYFSYKFKAITGKTPIEYRRQYQC